MPNSGVAVRADAQSRGRFTDRSTARREGVK